MLINYQREHNHFFKDFKFSSKIVTPEEPLQDIVLHKLSAIPIVRRNVLNCPKSRTRFAISGYKNFSRIITSGQDTSLSLKNLGKSNTVKHINNLEFDPYLCDDSCLVPLASCLKKFKNTKRVYLALRRVNEGREIDKISPLFYKLRRLEKIKLEFFKTTIISEEGFITIFKAMKKYPSLKSLDIKKNNVSVLSSKSEEYLNLYVAGLRKLEEIIYYEIVSKESIIPENDCEGEMVKFYRPHLKRLSLCWNKGMEWLSINENGNSGWKACLQFLTGYVNIRHFELKFIKYQIDLEDMVAMMSMLSKLMSLQNITLEFINNQITEREVLAFAGGVSYLPNLKSFTFKVLQNPNVSLECILAFVRKVSQLKRLERFSIYFRGINFLGERRIELISKLKCLENIKYEITKQSLTVLRIH